MKKYVLIAALILLIVIFSTFYFYRTQDLGDVINIEQAERILLTSEERERELSGVEREIPKVSQEQMKQLADFLNQYQVKLTMKKGWSSENPNEQFTLRLVYKNGDYGIYTLDRNIVATTRIYDVVNAPLDYKWLKEFESGLNSN